MIPYGMKKNASAKLHPHNKCGICSFSKADANKTAARREVRKIVDEEILGLGKWMEIDSDCGCCDPCLGKPVRY